MKQLIMLLVLVASPFFVMANDWDSLTAEEKNVEIDQFFNYLQEMTPEDRAQVREKFKDMRQQFGQGQGNRPFQQGFQGNGFPPPPPQFQGQPPHFQGQPPQFQGQPPHFQGQPPQFQGQPPHFQGQPPQFQGQPPQFPCPKGFDQDGYGKGKGGHGHKKWQNMTEEEKQAMKEKRAMKWENMTEEEKAQKRQHMQQRLQNMPEEKRQMLLEELQKLTGN